MVVGSLLGRVLVIKDFLSSYRPRTSEDLPHPHPRNFSLPIQLQTGFVIRFDRLLHTPGFV